MLESLLDEPLSNLDAKLRASAREELQKFQKEIGTTAVYVTHDQVEAMALGDRVVIMDHGRVRQVGTPAEVYDDPADTFVATFLGSPPMNLLERGGVVLGFRPEHVRAGAGPEGAARFRVRCDLTEYLGSEQLAYGTLQDGGWEGREIVWRFPSWEAAPPEGSLRDVFVERGRLRWFDAASGLRRAAP